MIKKKINCVFVCVFCQDKYVEMFYLLLESLLLYGDLDDVTDIVVYTSTRFMNMIRESCLYTKKIRFETNDGYDSIDLACKARLDIFELECINDYEKILYLDTDIIIKGGLGCVFDIVHDDVIYALEEGRVDDRRDYYGASLFGEEELQDLAGKSGFTTGILLFRNCAALRSLFTTIKNDIKERPRYFACYDQPYIVYNAFHARMINNTVLGLLAVNNNDDEAYSSLPGQPGVVYQKDSTNDEILERAQGARIN